MWVLLNYFRQKEVGLMKSNLKHKDQEKKQTPVYECSTCGALSDKSQQCCGQPMERKNRRIPQDDMAE